MWGWVGACSIHIAGATGSRATKRQLWGDTAQETNTGNAPNTLKKKYKRHTHTHTHTEDQCEWHRMTRMTGPDCVVMCNLINTHTHINFVRTHTHAHKTSPDKHSLHYCSRRRVWEEKKKKKRVKKEKKTTKNVEKLGSGRKGA